MAGYFAQKYRDLYKVHNVDDSSARHQAERRSQFLKKQRQERQDQVNESRGLVHAIENYSLPNYQSNRLPYRVDVFYRNKLQLSEWLRDRPDDLEQFVLVPCPKGKRNLVVASGDKTIAYSKSGQVIDIFQSSLQSGRYLTVLDCIFNEDQQTFYVLDVLIYHNQEFLLCDTSFRFYWIRSKFDEFDHGSQHTGNQYAFQHIDRADFDHPEEVEGMLSRYPLWEDNQPPLDGFLLYHKDGHYTHGKTPLVGWLCPWMIPELLGYSVNAEYLKQKPSGKALDFMNEFDEQRKHGQQKKRPFYQPKKKRNGGGGGGGDKSSQPVAKMEVQELVDGQPEIVSDLDDIDLEEHSDGAAELEDEEAIELDQQDNRAEATAKYHRSNQDQKRISTVFKF